MAGAWPGGNSIREIIRILSIVSSTRRRPLGDELWRKYFDMCAGEGVEYERVGLVFVYDGRIKHGWPAGKS